MAQSLSTESTLTQQFIAMTQGSSSATVMNLPNSLIEPFNITASTSLYANCSLTTNAFNDNLMALQAASTGHLPGYINPVHLRLGCRFNFTGGIAQSTLADYPVYNGNTTGKMYINGSAVLTGITYSSLYSMTEFTGGTAGGTMANPANAFDSSLSTYAGYPSSPFSQNATLIYDFGAGNAKTLKSFIMLGYPATDTFNSSSISGSNDGSNWTTLASTYTASAFITVDSTTFAWLQAIVTTPAPYRYYRYVSTYAYCKSVFGWIGSSNYMAGFDNSILKFGTGSLKLLGTEYVTGTAAAVSCLQLGNLDWHYRAFVRFAAAPTTTTLFTILGKQLEIQATSAGLRVNYSTDGSTFTTINSSAITWDTGNWHFISVRRTGNTLYFFVDGTPYGTVDLTGVSFFATATNTFYIGADSGGSNGFNGNIDELEFWVGESINDAIPLVERSSAYTPAVNWQSSSTYIPSTATEVDIVLFQDITQFSTLGVPVFGTNAHLFVSVDNGNTFHEVSLIRSGSLTLATTIWRGSLSLAGITNTTQLVYKITCNQGVGVLKYDGLIIYWPDATGTALTVDAIWGYPSASATVNGSVGKLLSTNLDGTVSSLGTTLSSITNSISNLGTSVSSIGTATSTINNTLTGITTNLENPGELDMLPNVTQGTVAQKIQAIFQYLFLRREVTPSQEITYKSDSTTILGTASFSDSGSTVDKGKMQ